MSLSKEGSGLTDAAVAYNLPQGVSPAFCTHGSICTYSIEAYLRDINEYCNTKIFQL